ncbi:hypothetical protein BXZ70DRAFT_1004329 [Cristinia sonorae]|uniref:Uncharacterized protein n=1 Tax=Cristinia sonorae TaxID=1940300 RepID=A0A8K0XTL9_9AGAR|nr:hypothetical protein BXZ70DRAFT_1004329 [Cristinia sonorae]
MNTATKRKWFKVEHDSDEDEPALGKQVLPVANLPEDFNGEPMDGLQYLFTVRRDARSLPHITRAANPYEFNEAPKPPTPPRSSTSTSVPMPSAEWREVFMKRFKNFRKRNLPLTLTDLQNLYRQAHFLIERTAMPGGPFSPADLKSNGTRQGNPKPHRATTETDEDISYEDNHAQIKAEASSGSLPTPFGTPGPTEEGEVSVDGDAPLKFAQREPTPSLVSKIDHRYALHLLMYFTHWINLSLEQPHPRPNHINESHARWIFILLSRVEDYVSADEMSLLRNLARACMALLRDNLRDPLARSVDGELERMSTRSCWFVIEIIVDHWAQRDLWMDAETMLTTIVP